MNGHSPWIKGKLAPPPEAPEDVMIPRHQPPLPPLSMVSDEGAYQAALLRYRNALIADRNRLLADKIALTAASKAQEDSNAL